MEKIKLNAEEWANHKLQVFMQKFKKENDGIDWSWLKNALINQRVYFFLNKKVSLHDCCFGKNINFLLTSSLERPKLVRSGFLNINKMFEMIDLLEKDEEILY